MPERLGSAVLELATDDTRLNAGMARARGGARQLDTDFDKASKNVQGGLRGMTIGGGRFGNAMQQAGFQVGDFAVQVGAGVSPMRAFAQQGSQILQVFGPFGAILGAAVAVGAAVADSMFDTGRGLEQAGDDAEDASEQLDQLIDIMTELRGVAEPTTAALQAAASNLVGVIELELREAQARLAEIERQARESEAPRQARERIARGLRLGGDEAKKAREEVALLNKELLLRQALEGQFADRFSTSARNTAEALELVADQEEDARRRREREAARAASQAEREAERRARGIEQVDALVVAMEAEAGLLQLTGRARAVQTAELRAEAIARRANVELSKEQRGALRDAAGELFDRQRAERKMRELNKQMAEGKGLTEELGRAFDRKLTPSVLSSIRSWEDLGQVALRVLDDVVNAIIQSQLAAQGKSGGGLGSLAVQGIGALIGALGGGGGTAGPGHAPGFTPGTSFGGPRQHGGPVFPGLAFEVGEAGRELFLPSVPGQIIPNDALRGLAAGGGRGDVFIDARGADQAAIARLESVIARELGPGRIERRAVAGVVDARRRDPRLFGFGA